jgi:hypothetical protein
MAWTLSASGTQTAVISTEHVLATKTDNGTYVLAVDTGAMVNGDILELRVYTKVLTGGTARVVYYAAFSHAQGEPNKYSPPVPCDIECKVTLKQTAGTGRDFPWALLFI